MNRSAVVVLSSFAAVLSLAGAATARSEVRIHPLAPARVQAKTSMQVFKSPTCGCCKNWIDHVRAAGFVTDVVDMSEEEMQAKKTSLGVGRRLASCHTAIVNGYVVEGHVPAADIRKMLREKPAIAGIAAPGMPVGSPGMEVPGGRKDKYDVVAFTKDGNTRVYASH